MKCINCGTPTNSHRVLEARSCLYAIASLVEEGILTKSRESKS